MLAATITVQGFPLLQLEDKVSFALQCMDDFDVQELAVVKDDYFKKQIYWIQTHLWL
jgi:hypothetical protein